MRLFDIIFLLLETLAMLCIMIVISDAFTNKTWKGFAAFFLPYFIYYLIKEYRYKNMHKNFIYTVLILFTILIFIIKLT